MFQTSNMVASYHCEWLNRIKFAARQYVNTPHELCVFTIVYIIYMSLKIAQTVSAGADAS